MKDQEPTFTTAAVCDLFEVPRTTLFRWEDIGIIPKVPRDLKGRRVYKQEQIEWIYLKFRLDTEENIALEDNRGNTSLVRALRERMFLVESVVGDLQEGLANLNELARVGPLSQRTTTILMAHWLSSYKRGQVIPKIPALMRVSDGCC